MLNVGPRADEQGPLEQSRIPSGARADATPTLALSNRVLRSSTSILRPWPALNGRPT